MFNKELIYILTILEAIEKINIYISEFNDFNHFFWENDQLNFNASVNLLIAIGEETKKINQEIKEKYLQVPWKLISGLRDKIAHDYRGIDPSIIWSVIKEDLPNLKSALISIFISLNIDEKILKEILQTKFYQHLNYLL